MGFPGVDYFDVDSMLTDDERMARDQARHFVDNEVLPIISEHFNDHTFPAHLTKQMADLGYLGCYLPEEYGCAGVNNVIYGLIMQELERGDSGVRSFCSVQTSLCMWPIFTYGTEEQRRKYLPKMATGELIGAFGLTEPDYGSDAGSMITRARVEGDCFVLNGAKMWITNATVADLAVVWAKVKLTGEEHEAIRGFIVEADTPGFSTLETHNKFSLRASITGELIFEDCRIPAANLLPGVKGLAGPLSCLNQARYGIAWGATGSAMACYQASLDYAKERVQFHKPIAAHQLVQHKLAWMLTEITKSQLMVMQLGRLKDAKKLRHQQVSMAKANCVGRALEIARVARDIHGANGITTEYPVIRHMLNLESVNTYEGTYDIHQLIVARDITGQDPFAV
ncbi:MAG: acyl-CoA dehydrogenase family protein [Candidatus Alcyoniella australis]|nr:acyl-CoA dehydrogenase family protein [Candidatus Alcyoniella australis]